MLHMGTTLMDKTLPCGRHLLILYLSLYSLPPSSGQGINQALEDIYSLSLLLTASGNNNMLGAFAYWQDMRQKRVDAVFDWATNNTNVQRLSEAERAKLNANNNKPQDGSGPDDMSWLYRPKLEDDVKAWIAEHL
jgi:hypothetical protein